MILLITVFPDVVIVTVLVFANAMMFLLLLQSVRVPVRHVAALRRYHAPRAPRAWTILLITVIPELAVLTVAVFANAMATVLLRAHAALHWACLPSTAVIILPEAIQGDVFHRKAADVDGKSERAQVLVPMLTWNIQIVARPALPHAAIQTQGFAPIIV